jgi:hypothetical protein
VDGFSLGRSKVVRAVSWFRSSEQPFVLEPRRGQNGPSLREFSDVIQRKKLDHTGAFDYFWADGANKFVLKPPAKIRGGFPLRNGSRVSAMVLRGEAWRPSFQELYQSAKPPADSRSKSSLHWAN